MESLLIQTGMQRVCSEWPQGDPVLEYTRGSKTTLVNTTANVLSWSVLE